VYDATPPTVSITKQVGQADPTNVSPILYTVVFSEPVMTSQPATSTWASSTTGSTTAVVTGSVMTYTVAGFGHDPQRRRVAEDPCGVATDAAGNSNPIGTVGADGDVAWDVDGTNSPRSTRRTLRATRQCLADHVYCRLLPDGDWLHRAADVQLGGGANPTAVVVTGSGAQTYTFVGFRHNQSGTVTAAVMAGAVTDALGNPSAGVDIHRQHGAVQLPNRGYHEADVSVTVDASQDNPASSEPILFDVTFHRAGDRLCHRGRHVDGRDNRRCDCSGCELRRDGHSASQGDVTVSVPADVAQDTSLNFNNGSSSGATVVFDSVAPSVVSITPKAGQPDPTNGSPVSFTNQRSPEARDRASWPRTSTCRRPTVGGSLLRTISGGPTIYTLDVTGMNGTGLVRQCRGRGGARPRWQRQHGGGPRRRRSRSTTWHRP
jgi:hypothetical protein